MPLANGEPSSLETRCSRVAAIPSPQGAWGDPGEGGELLRPCLLLSILPRLEESHITLLSLYRCSTWLLG